MGGSPKETRKKAERPLDAVRTGKMSVNAALLEVLRADMLSGAIQPGVKLKIPELCERYEVSTGAVREALSRLVPEGLVDFEDQRGFWSTPIDLAGLHDITRVRILVERETIRDAIMHGDKKWEDDVVRAHEALSEIDRHSGDAEVREWTARHKNFHLSLISACSSPWLVRLHNLFYDQTERHRLVIVAASDILHRPVRDVDAEHAKLVEMVLTRDVDRAMFLMESHLRITVDRVEATILASRDQQEHTGKSEQQPAVSARRKSRTALGTETV